MISERLQGKRGSAPLWTIFITIVLISFSLLIYTGMTLQSNYRQAQTEIERAANISLNMNIENQAVRDIQMTADLYSVQQSLAQNLLQIGYEKIDEQTWQRKHRERIVYTLENLSVTQNGEQILLNGDLVLPLLWGPKTAVRIFFNTIVQAIFIDY